MKLAADGFSSANKCREEWKVWLINDQSRLHSSFQCPGTKCHWDNGRDPNARRPSLSNGPDFGDWKETFFIASYTPSAKFPDQSRLKLFEKFSAAKVDFWTNVGNHGSALTKLDFEVLMEAHTFVACLALSRKCKMKSLFKDFSSRDWCLNGMQVYQQKKPHFL